VALLVSKKPRHENNSTQILELLNKILRLEYSLIVYYPRIAAAIRDPQVRQEVLQLGSASVPHADTVARIITKLGGTPEWAFDPFPDTDDLVRTFERQLEKEKIAYDLHLQSSRLAPDPEMRDSFARLAKEEQSHIRTVLNILTRLSVSQVPT
jgi:rubrerythrin